MLWCYTYKHILLSKFVSIKYVIGVRLWWENNSGDFTMTIKLKMANKQHCSANIAPRITTDIFFVPYWDLYLLRRHNRMFWLLCWYFFWWWWWWRLWWNYGSNAWSSKCEWFRRRWGHFVLSYGKLIHLAIRTIWRIIAC